MVIAFIPDMRIATECLECKEKVTIYIIREDWERWKAGEQIQDAFPYLSINDRELLVSRICETCFDRLFKEI
jgi:hypothetical protein